VTKKVKASGRRQTSDEKPYTAGHSGVECSKKGGPTSWKEKVTDPQRKRLKKSETHLGGVMGKMDPEAYRERRPEREEDTCITSPFRAIRIAISKGAEEKNGGVYMRENEGNDCERIKKRI